MKGGKNTAFGGFGSAMFAIKDVQNIYGSIDSKVEQTKNTLEIKPKLPKNEPINPPIPKKPIASQKQSQKPKIILKPSTITQPGQKNNQVPPNKTTPQVVKKLLSSQQQKNKPIYKLRQLVCMKVAESTFQLSLSNKPTKWNYHIFPEEGKHSKQIVLNPQITFSLTESNIRQGSIGNCYFICSLAALAKNIEILKRRIPNYQKYDSTSQSFKVNMFESGKLVQMNVQNSFQQSFSKPIQNDITPLILEKAYAQLYGNYEIINIGHSIDSLRDLSGHIAEYIDLKDKNKCVKEIMQAFESNHPMVIASKAKPQYDIISAKHSYNVLRYSYKNGEFFLLLRDPRGWTKAKFNCPQYIEDQVQNGEFWISYNELVKNFEVITVSRHISDSIYYYRTFGAKQLPVNGLKALMFEVNSLTNIGASIHQKHKKFFDKNHQYNVLNLMICQVDKNGRPIKTIKTNFNAQQVCSLTLELQKGLYAIVGQKYPFRLMKQIHPQELFTLSLNCSNQVTSFSQVSQFSFEQALTMYIQQNKVQFKALVTQQNLERYHGSLFGKVCILYQNYSDKNVVQELQYQSENIQVKDKKVCLEKGQVKLITHPIGPANNCSHKCTFKSKTYYKK